MNGLGAERSDAEVELLMAGELKSAHGIKGWLWLYSYTEPMENIFSYQPWQYKHGSRFEILEFESWKNQGSGLIVKLKGVDDRTHAEHYKGTKLYIDKCDLPAPETDEFYVSELLGLQARLLSGEIMGVIDRFVDNAAHPIVLIKPCVDSVDNQERLIPWHKDTIKQVDKALQQVVFDWFLEY